MNEANTEEMKPTFQTPISFLLAHAKVCVCECVSHQSHTEALHVRLKRKNRLEQLHNYKNQVVFKPSNIRFNEPVE